MPCSLASTLPVRRSCGPAASTGPDHNTSRSSSMHQFSRTLDTRSWRKQVCEVRPSRSSTLDRLPVAQKCTANEKSASTSGALLDHISSAPATSTKAVYDHPQRGCTQPPPLPTRWSSSSSDCCRCRWLRTASTSSPMAHSGRCLDPVRRRKLFEAVAESDNEERVDLPSLPPPPHSKSIDFVSPVMPTSPTSHDVCIHVDYFAGSDSCLPQRQAAVGVPRQSGDLALSVAVGGNAGTRGTCLDEIKEVDERSKVDHTTDMPPVTTSADLRRLATGCTVTTYV